MPSGQQGVIKILGDENVQYCASRARVDRARGAELTNGGDGLHLAVQQVYPALLPFAVYSTFHFLTYLCTNLILTIMPSAPGAPQPAIAETIARFVKKNYDASMHLVANLELFLWARVFLWCLVMWNSWVLLVVYTVFLRARYAQSVFVRDAMKGVELRGDALATDARVPEGARNAWTIAKSLVKRFGEVSNVSKILGAGQTVKKE